MLRYPTLLDDRLCIDLSNLQVTRQDFSNKADLCTSVYNMASSHTAWPLIYAPLDPHLMTFFTDTLEHTKTKSQMFGTIMLLHDVYENVMHENFNHEL